MEGFFEDAKFKMFPLDTKKPLIKFIESCEMNTQIYKTEWMYSFFIYCLFVIPKINIWRWDHVV